MAARIHFLNWIKKTKERGNFRDFRGLKIGGVAVGKRGKPIPTWGPGGNRPPENVDHDPGGGWGRRFRGVSGGGVKGKKRGKKKKAKLGEKGAEKGGTKNGKGKKRGKRTE